MAVEDAVIRDLETLGSGASGSALAETALALARELDDPGNSATSKSMCAKAIVDVLGVLRAVAPPREEKDELSRLREDRERRLAGRAAASHPSRP